MDRDNNFDFLRFLAASLVLFSHSYPLTGNNALEPIGNLTGIENGGAFAVATFFVLSGYLITASYQSSRNAFDYLWKRFLRLFPALAGVVILCAFVVGPLITTLSLHDYLANPLVDQYLSNIYLSVQYELPGVFTQNILPRVVNGSLWTLPIEMLMYLILLAIGGLRCLTPWIIAIVTGLFWLLKFKLLAAFGISDLIVFGTFPAMETVKLGAMFFAGSYLYLIRERFRPSAEQIILCLCMLIAAAFTGAASAMFSALMPLIVIWFAFTPLRYVSRFGRYGDFSYGIYVYAFPVQQLAVQFFGNSISPLNLFLVSYFPTVLLAIISWRLIEEPALRLKKRFVT